MVAGLVEARAPGDVAAAVARVATALRAHGVSLFGTIDHGAGSRAVGLTLADEVVLLFGNPGSGAPVVPADPRAGADLPLRVLIWSDGGTTRVAYRDAHQPAEHFDLDGTDETTARLRGLLEQLVQGAHTPG